MHKAGQPVDEAGKTIYELWTRSWTRLSRAVAGAVENRVAMWTRAAENRRKTPDGNVLPVAHRNHSRRQGNLGSRVRAGDIEAGREGG